MYLVREILFWGTATRFTSFSIKSCLFVTAIILERMGFLTSDRGVSTYDPATGEITGTITDYIQFATDCLGNQELEFQLVGYDSKEAELDALKSGSSSSLISGRFLLIA